MLLSDLKNTVLDHTDFKFLQQNDYNISCRSAVRIFLNPKDYKNIHMQFLLQNRKFYYLSIIFSFLKIKFQQIKFKIRNFPQRPIWLLSNSHLLIISDNLIDSNIKEEYGYFEFCIGGNVHDIQDDYCTFIYKRQMIQILTENERIIKDILE